MPFDRFGTFGKIHGWMTEDNHSISCCFLAWSALTQMMAECTQTRCVMIINIIKLVELNVCIASLLSFDIAMP